MGNSEQNTVLIIQNSHEGPGTIIDVLHDRQINYHLIKLEDGDIFPSPLTYKAIFILGGPDSANDQTDKMLQELAKLQEAVENQVPVFGICLGCQILVKLAGGKVIPGKEPEIGLRDPVGIYYQVQLTHAGQEDALFKNLNNKLKVFELHGEIIELPSSVQLLATGDFVKNQVVKFSEKSYGVLCHFEIKLEELQQWFSVDPMFDTIDTSELVRDFEEIRSEYYDNARQLFENYLNIVGT